MFLYNFIKNSKKNTLRNDYLEFAALSLLFLGGSLPEGRKASPIHAPGAHSHARWMSKVIFTIKIALFRDQLSNHYTDDNLNMITSLAVFFATFYSKMWLLSTNSSDAAMNDLNTLKTVHEVLLSLSKFPQKWPLLFGEIINQSKLKLEKHLSYLSERLVSLSIFSSEVTLNEKMAMKRALLKHLRKFDAKRMPQVNPYSNNYKTKTLKDFVGPDSWRVFNLLDMDTSFLAEHPQDWDEDPSYMSAKAIVENLPVVNDAAERVLGLATTCNTKTAPKSEDQLQALYKVVKGTRDVLRQAATSQENVTKRGLKIIAYDWEERPNET